jgi:hypothetical protein
MFIIYFHAGYHISDLLVKFVRFKAKWHYSEGRILLHFSEIFMLFTVLLLYTLFQDPLLDGVSVLPEIFEYTHVS